MKAQQQLPITDILRDAIVKSGIPYKAIKRQTGVEQPSIQSFVD
jgi:hypothetical protein